MGAPSRPRLLPLDTLARYPQIRRKGEAAPASVLVKRARQLRPRERRVWAGLIHGWQLECAVRLAEAGTPVGEAIRRSLAERHLSISAHGVVIGTRRTAPRGTFGPERFGLCLERALCHIVSVEAGMVACEVVGALSNFGELDGLCAPPVTAWELAQLLCAASRHALDPAKVAATLNRIGAHRRAVARQQRKQYRPPARKEP